MIAAVVGCGNWGARVVRRLAEFDDVVLSSVFDADLARARATAETLPAFPNGERTTALKDFTQYLDVQTPDAVVLAVPAGHRLPFVQAICSQHRTRKQRIRIEKPLGLDVTEAETIIEMCADAGVDLTIGFTLLHHPLYEAAFTYLEQRGEEARALEGIRVGRAPAHDVDAMLDLGVHAASIAAHLQVPEQNTDIVTWFGDGTGARSTRIIGDRCAVVVVDEVALTVTTPHGVIHVGDAHDALGCDLRAWIDGTHRGTPETALAAQRLVSGRMLVEAAA